jgi:hypothetical protein
MDRHVPSKGGTRSFGKFCEITCAYARYRSSGGMAPGVGRSPIEPARLESGTIWLTSSPRKWPGPIVAEASAMLPSPMSAGVVEL